MREIEVKILRGAETGQQANTRRIPLLSRRMPQYLSMNFWKRSINKQDHSLAFFSHAACRQAACGKCMVRVDGAVKLACKEKVIKDKITLEPYSDKVIRILCVSQSNIASQNNDL